MNASTAFSRAACPPGEGATPILKLRPVVPSEAEQARMLQPEDCGRTIAFVASMPPRVCMNEILISPTWNRGFVQTPHSGAYRSLDFPALIRPRARFPPPLGGGVPPLEEGGGWGNSLHLHRSLRR